MIIFEENFKWHLEAFASKLFIYLSSVKWSFRNPQTSYCKCWKLLCFLEENSGTKWTFGLIKLCYQV